MAAPFASRPPPNNSNNGPPLPSRFYNDQRQRIPPFISGGRGPPPPHGREGVERGCMDRRGPPNSNNNNNNNRGPFSNNGNGFGNNEPPGSFRNNNNPGNSNFPNNGNPNTFRNNRSFNNNNNSQMRNNANNGYYNNNRTNHDRSQGPPPSFRVDQQERQRQQPRLQQPQQRFRPPPPTTEGEKRSRDNQEDRRNNSRWESNAAAPALQESFSGETHTTNSGNTMKDSDGGTGILKSCSSSESNMTRDSRFHRENSASGPRRQSPSAEKLQDLPLVVEQTRTISTTSVSSNDESCTLHHQVEKHRGGTAAAKGVDAGVEQRGFLGKGNNNTSKPPSPKQPPKPVIINWGSNQEKTQQQKLLSTDTSICTIVAKATVEVATDKVPRRTKSFAEVRNDDRPPLEHAVPRRKPKATETAPVDHESQLSQRKHVKMGKVERIKELQEPRMSSGSSSSQPPERRSSTGSDRSNKAADGDRANQSPGGFRRLKKFSRSPPASPASSKSAKSFPEHTERPLLNTAFSFAPEDDKSPNRIVDRKNSKSPRKSIVEESDGLAITKSLQQAQQKLWEKAREREMKLQQIQEDQQRLLEEKQQRREERKRQKKLLRQQQREKETREVSQFFSTDAHDADDEKERKVAMATHGKSLNENRQRDKSCRLESKGNRRTSLDNVSVSWDGRNNLSAEGDAARKKKKSMKKPRLLKLANRDFEEDKRNDGPGFDAALSQLEVSWGLGLADTVKTRVRTCVKSKESGASAESPSPGKGTKKIKKRKRMDELDKDAAPISSGNSTVRSGKTKNKKTMSISEGYNKKAAGSEAISVRKKKKKLPPSSPVHAHPLYDDGLQCSGGAAPVPVKRKRGRPPKTKPLVTEHLPSIGNCVDHRPLKKRVAAAAAAVSGSWEQSTTMPSRVSISTAPASYTEGSSASELTHPVGGAHAANAGPIVVPPEIFSGSYNRVLSFEQSSFAGHPVVRPLFSMDSDSDSDSSSDDSGSDTDEDELFMWANKMFGTNAVPPPKNSREYPCATATVSTQAACPIAKQVCDMERRRQQQEEARALTAKEVASILEEEGNNQVFGALAGNWVRRSMRQPSRNLLNNTNVKSLLAKLRGNDTDMIVLKLKKYLNDPDTPVILIDATLEALEECTICESLYIQNYNEGMRDKQVLHLLKILQMPSCNIWCLNIGETYNVSDETWQIFADGLADTKITHMYASEHTITSELKDQIRDTIRQNRSKHNMHNDPNNLDTIIKCTHCWWNPINTKVLRPYLRKHGYESLLHDREAQGLRGSMSEAPWM